MCMCLFHQPVSFTIVHPTGRSQSFQGGVPVEETGVTVETVKKIGGGTDHPEGQKVRK